MRSKSGKRHEGFRCYRPDRRGAAWRADPFRFHRYTAFAPLCLGLVSTGTGTYQNQYEYSGNLLRLDFAQKRGPLDWDVEIAVPFLLGLPRNATATAPQGALGLGSNYFTANDNHSNTAMAFPKQLYARYRFGEKESQSVQAGRFEFNDASELTPKNATLATLKRDRVSQRLIGTFGFSDVGRSFDGFVIRGIDLPQTSPS